MWLVLVQFAITDPASHIGGKSFPAALLHCWLKLALLVKSCSVLPHLMISIVKAIFSLEFFWQTGRPLALQMKEDRLQPLQRSSTALPMCQLLCAL